MLVQQLDKLTLDSTLAHLPSHDFQVELTTLGQVIAQEFQQHSELPGVIITDANQIMGVISRTQFFEWLSRPYGLETFLKRPIRSLWKMIAKTEGIFNTEKLAEKYLLLSNNCSIEKAVNLALNRPASLAYEPILIEREDGQQRLLNMQVLLLAQSRLFALAKEAAEAGNRAKSEFLANMSHELLTPLSTILGFSQLISRESSLSPEHQHYLDVIKHSGEHLSKLLDQILLGKNTTSAFDSQITIAKADKIQTSQKNRQVIRLAPAQLHYRVLLAEHRPQMRIFLVKMLTSIGFCVREAENGQEAVEIRSSYLPHLILMNMRMPIMDGYQATRRIRSVEKFRRSFSQEQATVIIGLIFSAFSEDSSQVLSVGCNDFIYQPFREEVLLEKIAQHLGVRYLYADSEI